jgi:hypothetical protein
VRAQQQRLDLRENRVHIARADQSSGLFVQNGKSGKNDKNGYFTSTAACFSGLG